MVGKNFLLLSLFCCVSVVAFGQKRNAEQVTSVEPGFPEEGYSPSPKKKKAPKNSATTHDAKNNFYDRKEELDKQREKNSRYWQSTNQEYFGHRRPPRKHAPGRMKFCKVCGIRH